MLKRGLYRLIPISVIERYVKLISKKPKKLEKMLLRSDPQILEDIGKRKAMLIFKKASKEIPFYKKFLKKNKCDPDNIRKFNDFLENVPITSKFNYIKKAGSFKELCYNNDTSEIDILFESSGHSGKATIWPRSQEEEKEEKVFATIGLDLLFETYKYKTLFINTFAFGSWITGIEIARIADGHSTLINPGPDIEDTINIVKEFKNMFDQYIITGYPPFVKNLLEQGKKNRIDWKKYNINLILGGEPMPEEMRDYLYKLIGKKPDDINKRGYIYSAFGASDVGITGINEEFESIKIRRIARNNKNLKKDVYGDTKGLPLLFQYDPTRYILQVNENKEIIFSIVDLNSVLPLIKYNLQDIGGIISYYEMRKILKKNKINLRLRVPFPFVYIRGRSDGTVNFYGSLIFPTKVEAILIKNKLLRGKTTGNFHLKIDYDKKHNSYLVVEIQLKENVKIPKNKINLFTNAIRKGLFDRIPDLKPKEKYFKKVYGKKDYIIVRFYPFDKFPYHSKIKYKYD
ncbi:MAG: hypothetical protein ABII01_06180 [Candidatus Woesearchaeota archaeon]